MLYNPDRDLYELLAVRSDASPEQIEHRIDGLRGVKADEDLELAAAVLLDLHARTRYDTSRATYRMRRMLRESRAIFSGRTPFGIPMPWPPEET
jgi:hypothetical protein